MDTEKVLSFMEDVDFQLKAAEDEERYHNTNDYKLKILNRESEKAREACINGIFSNVYRNALPLDNEYKIAHSDELAADINDFITKRYPKGTVFFIQEKIKEKNPIACKIMEKANEFVNDKYFDKGLNIENIDSKDLIFKNDEIDQRKIDIIGKDLNMDDISEIIKTNVKNSALSEIERAKEEKENLGKLEKELANDMSITSEAAIEYELELRGYSKVRDFEPTLFQGMMIGNLEKLNNLNESSEPVFLFNALEEFGIVDESVENPTPATPEQRAFLESVKELTKLNILNTLKLEKIDGKMSKKLAQDYASMS